MDQIVYCNECKENFKIKAKKKYSKRIEEIYFICPHCKKRYTSYYTNGSIRRMQGQIRDLEQQKYIKIRLLIDEEKKEEVPELIDMIDKDIEKIRQQIKEEMRVLKNRFENIK